MGYTSLYDQELTRLAESKLGASTILVYMALAKYDHLHTGYVYPKIDTLKADLGGKYHRSSIEKALKNLEDKGLIKRKHFRSKRRYFLGVRKAAYLVFKMEQFAREQQAKKLLTGTEHVTDSERNMLRKNKNNLNRLYLSKPRIAGLGPMINHERAKPKPIAWRVKFLVGIQKRAWKKKPLTENQLKKFEELEKQYFSAGYSHPEIGSGGKGEHTTHETEKLEVTTWQPEKRTTRFR